jgi:hypothetical protein
VHPDAPATSIARDCLGRFQFGLGRPKGRGKFKQRFLYTTFERLTPETALTREIWNVAGRDGLHSLIW